METTKPPKSPQAIIAEAYTAYWTACREHDAAVTACSFENTIDKTIAQVDQIKARPEYTIAYVARMERVLIAVLAEHGATKTHDLNPIDAESLATWRHEGDMRHTLISIAERNYPQNGRRPNPWYVAMLDAIGQLPVSHAAGLLKAYNAWQDARDTARQVIKLRNEAQPPIRWYIDVAQAESDREDAWTAYRSTPGAPASLAPYAWPGGAPLYYCVETDAGTIDLCPRCAADEEPIASYSQQAHEEGPPIICEECNAQIESAYGDPDEGNDEAA